jgi:acyl-CoA synthetase (AMP-forming)/AMP-acid ligase II
MVSNQNRAAKPLFTAVIQNTRDSLWPSLKWRFVKKFHNLVEALAAAPPDRPFITHWIDEDEQETVTFGQFRQRARVHASKLLKNGVTAGDRVVLIMPQGIPAMAAFAGAMMIGAIPAFLAYPNFKVDPAKYRSGLLGVTANLGAKIVVIDEEFPEEMLTCVALTDGQKLVRLSATAPSNDATLPEVKIASDALAFIQHSAGTTGLQKGVALTHESVLTQLDHLSGALQIDGAHDRIYSWLPLYHDMGLIACFMLPMVYHLPIVMQSPIDWVMHPDAMLQIITEHRCTLTWMPNFAFQFVSRRTPTDTKTRYDLSSLRALINCSEPVRSNSMDEFQTTFASSGLNPNALQSSYAMAENVFAVTQSQNNGPAHIWADGRSFRGDHCIVRAEPGTTNAICFTSSGRLFPNQLIRIAENGVELQPGHVGEILIQSDCLFRGYYNRPDLTTTAIIDGWYHTGDLGFLLDNELYVVGRKKDLLIIGGENIYPQDIEEIVAAVPAIHDGRAVALGVYNPEIGTEEIVVVAEVNNEKLLARKDEIEQAIRSGVVAGLGVAVKQIFLKPPKWIVKSTAGKAARSTTRDKLLREHPELNSDNSGPSS